MARRRNPKRDEARELWLKHKGKKTLASIAKELELPPSRVRKWKSEDKWQDNLKRSAPISKGSAPFESLSNNKNAAGNSGGAAPPGNKNAVTTGQYETIMFDQLSDEERAIFEGVTDDPLVSINTEIRQLKVRQYRINKRIKNVIEGMDDSEVQTYYKIKQRKRAYKDESGNKIVTQIPETTATGSMSQTYRKFDDLLKLEDALTAVGNSLLKALKEKSKLMDIPYKQMIDEQNMELTKQKIRIIKHQADEIEGKGADNPIINAMSSVLAERMKEDENEDTD